MRRLYSLAATRLTHAASSASSVGSQVVRTITGLGLKEAKELVEAAPKTIKEAGGKEECEGFKKELEDAGAVAALK